LFLLLLLFAIGIVFCGCDGLNGFALKFGLRLFGGIDLERIDGLKLIVLSVYELLAVIGATVLCAE
jgi:hypothetical protein